MELDQYITIPAIARMEYNLKGNDLLVYGIIHGFTQHRGWCECSLQYICDWIGCSDKSRVSIIISRLVDAGIIEKQDVYVNNVKFCKYRAKAQYRSENHNGGVVESTTNNNIDNNTPYNNPTLFEDKFSHKDSIISPQGVESAPVDDGFDAAWKAYGRKGNKMAAHRYWKKLSAKDRKAIMDTIPLYLAAMPDEKYRKDFSGWINPTYRRWEDKIVNNNQQQTRKEDNHVWTV